MHSGIPQMVECSMMVIIHMYVYLSYVLFFQLEFTSPQAQFTCTECPATFRSYKSREVHINQHRGLYKYYCPYCSKGHSASINLKLHIKRDHTGIPGFICSWCRQDLGTCARLKSHLEECSQKGQQPDGGKSSDMTQG